jgi:alkylation response protein AidB-like acyl-CoA dehydrogenase
VQLTFDAEVEAFRAEFSRFLDENLPREAEAAAERSRSTSHVPDWARRWQQLQFDHGWLVPGNPPEFGGRNAGVLQQFVHREELSRRRIYHCFNPQGVGIVAASLLSFGTDEQKRRWAVPVLRAEMTASLGMSEPGACETAPRGQSFCAARFCPAMRRPQRRRPCRRPRSHRARRR